MVEVKDYWLEEIDYELETSLETSKGVSNELDSVLFGIECSDGVCGIGEAAPSVFTGESSETIKATLGKIGESLMGENPLKYRELIEDQRDRFFSQYSALTGLEIALFDYLSKKWRTPLNQLFGGGDSEVETDITLSITSIKESKELVHKYLEQGFDVFKAKVGKEPNKDLERIKEIYETIKKYEVEPRIRLDANQAFTPKQAIKFTKELKNRDVAPEFFEQPVHKNDLAGLKFVRENTSIPVVADESLFSPKDAMELTKKGCVDVFNIKLMESGLIGAMDIVSIAEPSFVDLMIGCMAESSVSIKTAAYLVQGTNAFTYVDLDSAKFLKTNLVETKKGKNIGLGDAFGHGVKKEDL